MRASSTHVVMRRPVRVAARGFTLIELMVAVAVVAILATIAYPSYQEQVRKSRRAQAKADLVELTQNLERFRTVNNTYAGITLPFTQSPRDGAARYTVGVSGNDATAFLLTATPTGNQADDRCGTLTINQAGVKTENGSANYEDCW